MLPAALATILVLFGLMILGVLEKHVFVSPNSVAYQAEAASTAELYNILDRAHRDERAKVIEVRLTTQPETARVDFTLEARPETHRELLTELRAAFDTRKITTFSSSDQE